MTYEERIAAAQAKMEAFKAKMAASAEKAKAARAMKKEEIAAEYIEKYGEGEIEEIPEKVEVEGAE